MQAKTWMVLVSILLISHGGVFGQNSMLGDTARQAVVDDIYANPNFLPLIDIQQAKVQLSDLSKSFEQAQNRYSEMDEHTALLEDQYGDIRVTIEHIISDTARTKKALKETLTAVSLHQSKIKELKNEIITLETDLQTTRENLSDYAQFLYKISNDYYTKDLAVSTLKLFVKSDNIAASLSTDALVQMLMMQLEELLHTIKKKQLLYANYMLTINKTKLAYQDSVVGYKQQYATLNEQKNHLYELMTYIQGDLTKAKAKLQQLSQSKVQLQNQIETIKVAKVTHAAADSATYDLLNSRDRDDGNKYLTWPVLPVKNINFYFKDTDFLQEFDKEFPGIDIDVPQGSLVRAAAPGIVYKVSSHNDVSLNWLAIVHKFGYVTFYSPMSSIVVKEGEVVQRGQVIGKSGGEPGTNGAGVDSSSPHLQFELLKNGEHIDPLLHLDISIFPQKNTLPKDYKIKYIQDYFAREVELAEEKIEVVGDSVEERRDDFLQRYATGPYRDPAIWYDAAENTGIDPLFGICIGFAETSFKHFKSLNNIGNVGNNDRGDVVEFPSALAGVIAMYSVFNNQYLGKYTTLDQLSRYGNTDGFIYASSPYNRQKNIMKCLSAMHGYAIPEDYPIRIPVEK